MRGAVVSRSVVTVSLVVVAVAFGLDRFSDPDFPDGVRLLVQVLVVVAALAVAGISYNAWSTTRPQSPRLMGAMVTSLIGGAGLASAVTSAENGALFGGSQLPALGVVALTFAVVLLNSEARQAGS